MANNLPALAETSCSGRKTVENLPAHRGGLHRQDRNGSLGQKNSGKPARSGRKALYGQENGRNPARTTFGWPGTFPSSPKKA